MKPNEVKNKILRRLGELENEACFSGGTFIKSKSNFLNFVYQQLYECKDLDFNFIIHVSLTPNNSICMYIIKPSEKFSMHFLNDKTIKCSLTNNRIKISWSI